MNSWKKAWQINLDLDNQGCAVLCCAVLCCAVLCCAVLCCAVLCCAVLCCAVLCIISLLQIPIIIFLYLFLIIAIFAFNWGCSWYLQTRFFISFYFSGSNFYTFPILPNMTRPIVKYAPLYPTAPDQSCYSFTYYSFTRTYFGICPVFMDKSTTCPNNFFFTLANRFFIPLRQWPWLDGPLFPEYPKPINFYKISDFCLRAIFLAPLLMNGAFTF